MVLFMVLSSLQPLEGKVALITGGASGIGECTARLFSKHGAKLLIADIQTDLAESLCKDLRSGSGSASFIRCDVTKEADVKSAVDAAVSEFGKLDIMFNNAGIVDAPKPDITENEAAVFEKVLKVNLIGPFLGTKHAARVMKPVRRGSIINTASICSVVGGVASHAYVSSKHGVLGLAKNAAVELGRYGIWVNCISPYVVPTPLSKEFYEMYDEGVLGLYANLKGAKLNSADVAEAAVYLGSDESKSESESEVQPWLKSESKPAQMKRELGQGGPHMPRC